MFGGGRGCKYHIIRVSKGHMHDEICVDAPTLWNMCGIMVEYVQKDQVKIMS